MDVSITSTRYIAKRQINDQRTKRDALRQSVKYRRKVNEKINLQIIHFRDRALMTKAEKTKETMRRRHLFIGISDCQVCGIHAELFRLDSATDSMALCKSCRVQISNGAEYRKMGDQINPTDFSDLDQAGVI